MQTSHPVTGNPNYRPDIDGLRAVAVLSVLFYHVGFSVFSGGFVGVDVFFVISGFLITKLIRDEVARTSGFSFSRFYVRRARRLLPALMFTLLFSAVAGAFILAPPHLERFGGALVHALASFSNFYFWFESGYFDADATIKPLLHTWSLGVEEQFYFIWPLALVLALRVKKQWAAPVLLAVAGAISLWLNTVFADGSVAAINALSAQLPKWLDLKEWFSDGRATIFYLLPFRVFEFAIGGVLVWLTGFQLRQRVILDILLVFGLAMIAYSVFAFDEDTVFPSYNALIPCIGSALAIYAGQAPRAGMMLRNPGSVWIGLTSYSLYLVHWPIIVFWSYAKGAALGLTEQLVVIAASLAASAFMFMFVEKPFRRPKQQPHSTAAAGVSGPAFGVGLFAVTAAMFILASNMWSNNGWPWRYANTLVAQEMTLNTDELNDYVWRRHLDLERPFSDRKTKKILVIGDSMAADFVNVLFESGLNDTSEIRTIPIRKNCDSILPVKDAIYTDYKLHASCREQHRKNLKNRNWRETDTVILAFSWNPRTIRFMAQQLRAMRKAAPKAEFLLVGPKSQSISGVEVLREVARSGAAAGVARYTTAQPENHKETMDDLYAFAKKHKVAVLDVAGIFCRDAACRRFNNKGNLIIYDRFHLTPLGAQYVGRRIRQMMETDADLDRKFH